MQETLGLFDTSQPVSLSLLVLHFTLRFCERGQNIFLARLHEVHRAVVVTSVVPVYVYVYVYVYVHVTLSVKVFKIVIS